MEMSLLYLFFVGTLIFFLTIFAFTRRYKRCPSDKILVVFGKISGDLVCLLLQLVIGNHSRHQSKLTGFRGAQSPVGQHQFLRLAQADQARQEITRAAIGA